MRYAGGLIEGIMLGESDGMEEGEWDGLGKELYKSEGNVLGSHLERIGLMSSN